MTMTSLPVNLLTVQAEGIQEPLSIEHSVSDSDTEEYVPDLPTGESDLLTGVAQPQLATGMGSGLEHSIFLSSF